MDSFVDEFDLIINVAAQYKTKNEIGENKNTNTRNGNEKPVDVDFGK